MSERSKGPSDTTGKDEAPQAKPLNREDHRERCAELAPAPDILSRVDEDARRSGFAGPTVILLVVFLAAMSRLFAKPVSVALAGPSSAGKSFTIQKALEFHPPEAVFVVTGMSEKALIYMDTDLKHRMLVIQEAAGLSGDFLSYGIRTLLSEGRLDYWYTDFDVRKARQITKEGPTGLITSSVGKVDAELATRVIMPTVKDDSDLTKAIMVASAEEVHEVADRGPYHDLQRYIAAGPCGVTVPYAKRLAIEADSSAVRMRRDFPAVLELTRAHALLHQDTRDRNEDGRIVATPDDYAAVHTLVAELVAEGAERAVPETVRETVKAVNEIAFKPGGPDEPVTIAALAKHLALNRSSVSRRANRALDLGFLKDESLGRGRAKKLLAGDPMPEDTGVLPPPEILR